MVLGIPSRTAATCRPRLSAGVSTVDDEVSSGCVGAGVGNQVDIGALELLGESVAAEGDHGTPELLRLGVDKVGEASVDVARRNRVDSSKVAPLVCQRASHVNAAGLGDIVRRLLLGEVGNVPRHGRRDDKGAVALLLEVSSHGLGAVRSAVQVDLDDLVPGSCSSLNDTGIGRGTGTDNTLLLASKTMGGKTKRVGHTWQ